MNANNFIAILLVLLCMFIKSNSQCPKNGDQFLVSFHPHLDAFWLDTDDDLKRIDFNPAGFLFAMNQRNSKVILNSMLQSLTKDQKRKYFISEIVFFKDWFDYLDQTKKLQVRKLLKNGQLQIVNGGWVQNDEAVCYMDDIIDQYTIGNNYLNQNFQIKTKIGWATDSFGHSHSQVAIQHLLGFQFQGIQRIDDRYIYQRKENPLLQFYWSPVSDSNRRKYGGVFTHVRHFLHEVNDLRQTNEDTLKADFNNLQQNMKKLYINNKFFRFLGNDFEEFITQQFQVLQKCFEKLNDKPDCPVYKYGNPSDYLQRLKELFKQKMPVRQFDLMPNYDQDHYWSGYYTTNPQLKKICKDFSRFVNFFRKVYINYLIKGGQKKQNIIELIVKSDQLVSIMQHHDGITATSKYHIEVLFQQRMETKTQEIIKTLAQLQKYPMTNCKMYQKGNICQIDSQDQKVYLSIIHEGGQKKQRIQLLFIKDTIYDITNDESDQVFCHPVTQKCSIVFQPTLKNGENIFILQKIDKSKIVNTIKPQGNTYKDTDFELIITNNNELTYNFNNEFIKLSIVKSPNRIAETNTFTWDKYGKKIDKMQVRRPGIYIMSNSGQITRQEIQLKTIYITKGKFFTKIILPCKTNEFILTIKNSQKNILDVSTKFKPTNQQAFDYFIQIQSKLDSKGQFYHDSNGYLVSKRKVGFRPDYNWQYKSFDKINANTYPMCSFAYAIQGEKKLVVFTDRAQGFTQFEKTYLINIDRLADDDYKGVGEGYRFVKQNIFHHRIALVKSTQFIERQWQKSYDQPLLGFYSKDVRSIVNQPASKESSEKFKYLKYTVFNLNQDQFVIRLFNLADNSDIKVPKYSYNQWSIPDLDLKLKFVDIRQAYANGILLAERVDWANIQGEINMATAHLKDQQKTINLSPLQVRSFRINLKGKIKRDQPLIRQSNLISLSAQDRPRQAIQLQPVNNPLIGVQLTDVFAITEQNC